MFMKCVLIIGGNCDIGRALVNYYLDKNYNVVVGYHNNDYNYDKRVEYLYIDVTNYDSIEKLIVDTKNKYGNIDTIINLACICMDNDFLDKSKEEFMRVLEVNLVGTFLCNQIYSKYIDDGLIINMASTDGIDTYSRYSIDYSASKAGVINISKSIALATNNRVICLCPNWIDSDSTRNMEKEYLDNELKRIKQDRLIKIYELVNSFNNIINSNFNSGDIFRIDIEGDKVWVKRM